VGAVVREVYNVGVAVVISAVCGAGGAALLAVVIEDRQRVGFVVFCAVLAGLLGGASTLTRSDRSLRADAAARATHDRAVTDLDATGRRVLAALLDVGAPPPTDSTVDRQVELACGPVRTAVDAGLRSMATVASQNRRRRATDLVRRIIDAPEPVTVASARVTAALTRPATGSAAAWRLGHRTVSSAADLDAVSTLAGAGHVWWWAHPEFVVVSEPPVELHVEYAGGSYRPHRTDGPAVRWRDGLRMYFWHGTRVPAGLIERGWTVEEIHRHHNSEVRRAAIERMGWLTYIDRAGLRLVASAPDPGNHPHELRLYEDPRRRLGPTRVLVMTNGSPDGTDRPPVYAETVPGHLDDPVEAAAWQYDCPVDVYRTLQRRT
jgi:hypothetical protein